MISQYFRHLLDLFYRRKRVEAKQNKFSSSDTTFSSYCMFQLPNMVSFLIEIFDIWCTLNSLINEFLEDVAHHESNSLLKEQLYAM